MPYKEARDRANEYRAEQLREIQGLIGARRGWADERRAGYFDPKGERWARFIEARRADFLRMLGWPLCELRAGRAVPGARVEFVAEDELGRIERVWIEALDGARTYGLLFTPRGQGPHPLVLALHGGLGTPELCASFLDEHACNYNDMVRRVLAKGYAVFAPQLLLWGDEFGPPTCRQEIDAQLKQLGGSITALEIAKLMRALDWLRSRPDIDGARAGVVGLSYGGFYALFFAAVDPRLRACASSCFFNDRYRYAWLDWTWTGAAERFLDPEVCALVSPRPLYVEVGRDDPLFDVGGAAREAARAKAFYAAAGCADKFTFAPFDGVHELSTGDGWLDFLCANV